MVLDTQSILWGIALSLFLGGLGFPIPENPLLMGGGCAISQQLTPSLPSIALWFIGIICGDLLLFVTVFWLFSRPPVSRLVSRIVRQDRLEKYQKTFARLGGWTLFLARFTFGIRAVAYIAAGAARYPLARFLAVDGISVAIQVLLFVGIGYYAGERINWAEATVHDVMVLLTILALVAIFISVGATVLMKRFAEQKS